MDFLRKQILQANRNVQAIKEEFGTFNLGLRQWQNQWKSADPIEQEAFKGPKRQEYKPPLITWDALM